MILETKRLYLRELTQADFKDLAEILQDPEVMYAYERDFTDQDVQDWLDRQLARYQKYGFGLWAVILKDTGEMAGQAGLTMQPCEGEEVLEVGYLLKKRFWHKGYAREAAQACKAYAFEELNAEKVHAIVKVTNAASIRVAESMGMGIEKKFIKVYDDKRMPHYLFAVSRQNPAL